MKDCDRGPKNETAAGTRLKLREPRPDLLLVKDGATTAPARLALSRHRKNIQSRGFLELKSPTKLHPQMIHGLRKRKTHDF